MDAKGRADIAHAIAKYNAGRITVDRAVDEILRNHGSGDRSDAIDAFHEEIRAAKLRLIARFLVPAETRIA